MAEFTSPLLSHLQVRFLPSIDCAKYLSFNDEERLVCLTHLHLRHPYFFRLISFLSFPGVGYLIDISPDRSSSLVLDP